MSLILSLTDIDRATAVAAARQVSVDTSNALKSLVSKTGHAMTNAVSGIKNNVASAATIGASAVLTGASLAVSGTSVALASGAAAAHQIYNNVSSKIASAVSTGAFVAQGIHHNVAAALDDAAFNLMVDQTITLPQHSVENYLNSLDEDTSIMNMELVFDREIEASENATDKTPEEIENDKELIEEFRGMAIPSKNEIEETEEQAVVELEAEVRQLEVQKSEAEGRIIELSPKAKAVLALLMPVIVPIALLIFVILLFVFGPVKLHEMYKKSNQRTEDSTNLINESLYLFFKIGRALSPLDQ